MRNIIISKEVNRSPKTSTLAEMKKHSDEAQREVQIDTKKEDKKLRDCPLKTDHKVGNSREENRWNCFVMEGYHKEVSL